MNALRRYFSGVKSFRNPAMTEPSGVTLEAARLRFCDCRQGRDPCTCSTPKSGAALVDARLNDLHAQRRAIDTAIESLEIERMLITGEEPEFVRSATL